MNQPNMSIESNVNLLNSAVDLSNLPFRRTGQDMLSPQFQRDSGDLSEDISMPVLGFSFGDMSPITKYPNDHIPAVVEHEDEDLLAGDGMGGVLDFSFNADGEIVDMPPENSQVATDAGKRRSSDSTGLEFDILGLQQKRRKTDKHARPHLPEAISTLTNSL